MSAAGAKPQPVTPSQSAGNLSSTQKQTVVLCALLLAVTAVFYFPVGRNAFVNFDDDHYITGNPHVIAGLSWQTVQWAFTQFYEANWHPLTWLSHALDCQLFGLNPAGLHYENVVWHGINAVLIFLLLMSATGRRWSSLMVAALFALHPVNVESVAWASERKNLLSMMFLLLGLLAYGWYAKKLNAGRYALVAAMFACGLMSKPQVITLPFVLLLWDYWPLGRSRNLSVTQLVVEKVPLFLLAAISAVVTVRAQKAGGAIHSAILYPFHLRLENAIVSYARYMGKALWPAGLSPLYPHPLDLLHTWQVFASIALLALITAFVLWKRERGYLPVGWFWFLGTLVPMIGIIQVGEQAMADRYAYLPLIGLFIAVIWGLAEFCEERHFPQPLLALPAVLILIVLGSLTYRQVGYWRDSETLWTHALNVTDVRSYKSHFNLAMAYDQEGKYNLAIAQLAQSIDPRDDDPRIHLGLGIYDQRHGDTADAIGQYQAAIKLASDPALKAEAYSNLGGAYRQLKNYAAAKDSFSQALQLDPNKTLALVGLGLVAQHEGNFDAAAQAYSRAMAIEPTPVGYLLLAKALDQGNHPNEAKAAHDRAAQLTNDLSQAQQAADHLLSF